MQTCLRFHRAVCCRHIFTDPLVCLVVKLGPFYQLTSPLLLQPFSLLSLLPLLLLLLLATALWSCVHDDMHPSSVQQMTRALSVLVLIRPFSFSLFFDPSSSWYLSPRLQGPSGPLVDVFFGRSCFYSIILFDLKFTIFSSFFHRFGRGLFRCLFPPSPSVTAKQCSSSVEGNLVHSGVGIHFVWIRVLSSLTLVFVIKFLRFKSTRYFSRSVPHVSLVIFSLISTQIFSTFLFLHVFFGSVL